MLYAMLPLFCKIFSAVQPNLITEKFADVRTILNKPVVAK